MGPGMEGHSRRPRTGAEPSAQTRSRWSHAVPFPRHPCAKRTRGGICPPREPNGSFHSCLCCICGLKSGGCCCLGKTFVLGSDVADPQARSSASPAPASTRTNGTVLFILVPKGSPVVRMCPRLFSLPTSRKNSWQGLQPNSQI